MLRFSGFAVGLALGLCAVSVQPLLADEGILMKDVLGTIGLIDKEHEEITYRERAPLVVPPKLDLPKPIEGDLAMSHPEWPKDPDVVAKKKAAAAALIPVTETERRRQDNNPRLSIEDIRAGRKPGAEVTTEPVRRGGDNNREDIWIRPDVLMQMGRKEAGTDGSSSIAYGSEPTRRVLTDPPTGLRKPSASAPIPKNVTAEPFGRVKDDSNEREFARTGNAPISGE